MDNWRARITTCVYIVLLIMLPYTECQECGDNPMKQVLMVAKRTGRPVHHVLHLLRDIDAPAYDTLERKFRLYAACVGLVDTGYFRKRSSNPLWTAKLRAAAATLAAKDAASSPKRDFNPELMKLEMKFEPQGLATLIHNYRMWPKEYQLAWNAFWPIVYNAEQQALQQKHGQRERDFSRDTTKREMPVDLHTGV